MAREPACGNVNSSCVLRRESSAPRAASVIAKGDGTLWALDRISFRTILLDVSSLTYRRSV